MKKYTLPLSLILLLVLVSCGKKETAGTGDSSSASTTTPTASATGTATPVSGKYQLQSAIITSQMEMPSLKQRSTEVLYFDGYGAREARETIGDMMGMKMHTLAFTKDGYMYTIDLERKTGTKMKGGVVSANMDYSTLSPKLAEEYHVKKEGTEVIAGKTCDIYSMDSHSMKGRVSSWQGIPMRTDAEVSGMQMKSSVTKIEENASIPADKFEVPAGVTIKEM